MLRSAVLVTRSVHFRCRAFVTCLLPKRGVSLRYKCCEYIDMGCSTSILLKQGPLPLSRSAEKPNEDRPTFLTEDQRDAIRETWLLIHAKGALNVSKRIFLFIFQLKPEVKSYFPFRGVWGDELFAHPQFRDHVTRFVSTIDAVVDNVNNIEDEVIMFVKKPTVH